ncbi:MAG: hypothetical protein GW850_13115 [Sphingomonadales bacterium]|nr:hypothetical protein [Sphingomonadales bacterium]
MTYQDEFARRNARGAGTGEGGDPNQPLLFRGGDIRGGGDAPASLAPANGGGAGRDGLEMGGPRSAERNHPNPVSGETAPGRFRSVRGTDRPETFKKEGLRDTVSGEPVEPRLSEQQRPSGSQTARSATGSGLTEPPQPHSCSALDAEPCGLGTGSSENAQSSASSAEHTPTRAIRHDGWLPETRVKFLEALARTGNVQASAYFVQMTRQSAYDLRRRDRDFARGWLAALVLARDIAQDKLQERAIEGVEEEVFYHGEVVATRRRFDSRLLLALLGRLDKIAEQIPAQRGAARFGELMEAIAAGEDTAPLVATPTEDELAILAAEADAWQQPAQPPEEAGDEFYAVTFPDHDGPPDYYRMTPEEAAEMTRDVPGLTATPTGTSDDAVITALVFEAEAEAQFQRDAAEEEMNL